LERCMLNGKANENHVNQNTHTLNMALEIKVDF